MILLYILTNWKWLLGAAASAGLAIALTFTAIDRNQWRATSRKQAAVLALVKPAQELALAKAKQAIADTESRYKGHANDADTAYAAGMAAARTDTDRFIAAHRVPVCAAGGAASGTAPAASGGSAGVPADLSGYSIVANADVQACSGAATYAMKARDWALGLDSVSK